MARYIDADEQVGIGYLSDWYQSSIDDTKPPIWTDGHLEELTNDFIVIPKDTPTADVAEIKNMKWRRHYYISSSLMGGKYEDGWICSVCGKHSYSRKEICDGCNTKMWTINVL